MHKRVTKITKKSVLSDKNVGERLFIIDSDINQIVVGPDCLLTFFLYKLLRS